MEKYIKQLIKTAQVKPHGVYFLNTKQELKDFYLQDLKKYKTWKAIANIENWLPVDAEFLQDFRKQLNNRKIKTRVLFQKEGLKHEPGNLKYREVKIIPSQYKFKSSVDILPDKLLIMNPELKVLGLVIEIESVLDIFNDIFDFLWATLPPIKK